jgi:hypothetical protein
MQFSPVLTTVRALTCTTWRFVDVLIARLRCWLYPHLQFRLNFYTSAGYHYKISLITKGWDCFGWQVTATLRAMRRLIGTSVDRSPVFHCQLQLSGIWIESGSLTHILNIGSHFTVVDNSSFGLNTRSCKQPNTSWVCPKNSSEFWFLLSRGTVALMNIRVDSTWFFSGIKSSLGSQKLGFGPSKPIPKYFCILFRLTFVARPSKVSQSVWKC